MNTFFWYDLQQKGLHVFFYKCWVLLFEIKQRWAPFLPRFLGILPSFSGICPDFRQIKTFRGVLAPPAKRKV